MSCSLLFVEEVSSFQGVLISGGPHFRGSSFQGALISGGPHFRGPSFQSVLNKGFALHILIPLRLQDHYYQPMWTLVGGGVKTLEDSRRNMSDVMTPQADWLKTSVTGFRPEENVVLTSDGSKVKYDYLIVAVGLKVAFEKVT